MPTFNLTHESRIWAKAMSSLYRWEKKRTNDPGHRLAGGVGAGRDFFIVARTDALAVEGLDEAIARVEAAQGFAWFRASGALNKAAGLAIQGRPDEAVALALRSLDAFRAVDAGHEISYALSILRVYTHVGRFEDAGRTLDEDLALEEKRDDNFQETELHPSRPITRLPRMWPHRFGQTSSSRKQPAAPAAISSAKVRWTFSGLP
jgi:hypothetical protein